MSDGGGSIEGWMKGRDDGWGHENDFRRRLSPELTSVDSRVALPKAGTIE